MLSRALSKTHFYIDINSEDIVSNFEYAKSDPRLQSDVIRFSNSIENRDRSDRDER